MPSSFPDSLGIAAVYYLILTFFVTLLFGKVEKKLEYYS